MLNQTCKSGVNSIGNWEYFCLYTLGFDLQIVAENSVYTFIGDTGL